MTYAVLLKCHFWDGFAKRQLDRLIDHAPGGDVFVVVNESAGPVPGIDYDESKIIRVTEGSAKAVGLEHQSNHNMYWYSGDYHLHLMTRRYPDYDYYIVLEHDALIMSNMDELVRRMAEAQIDYASQPIREPLLTWGWLPSCEGVYAFEDIRHWLISIMLLSHRAAHTLFERRVRMGQRLRDGELRNWPFSEAAVPTEMHLAGYKMATLDQLGSIRYFAWAPPFVEDALPAMEGAVFVHPVLDARRFVAGLDQWMSPAEAFFSADHPMRQRIIGDALALYLPRLHGRLWSARHFELAERCTELMRSVGDADYHRRHGLAEANVGLNKPAVQSSLSEFSVCPEEARGALTGPVSGQFKFHTTREYRPWWMVDLLVVEFIDEIRVFNRIFQNERAHGLELHVSRDGRSWNLAATHTPQIVFGQGPDTPWIVQLQRAVRFVRLELPRDGVLHLDQVHVIRGSKLVSGTGFEKQSIASNPLSHLIRGNLSRTSPDH